MIAAVGTAPFFRYNQDHTFVNTETGNFALFRSADCLVLAEIISVEEEAVLPWKGLALRITPNSGSSLALKGFGCFFDAGMAIPEGRLPEESLYALARPGVWNTAVLPCDGQEVCEVSSQSPTLHLAGRCFRSKA